MSPPVPVPWAAHGAGGAAAAALQELPPPGESRNAQGHFSRESDRRAGARNQPQIGFG